MCPEVSWGNKTDPVIAVNRRTGCTPNSESSTPICKKSLAMPLCVVIFILFICGIFGSGGRPRILIYVLYKNGDHVRCFIISI